MGSYIGLIVLSFYLIYNYIALIIGFPRLVILPNISNSVWQIVNAVCLKWGIVLGIYGVVYSVISMLSSLGNKEETNRTLGMTWFLLILNGIIAVIITI